MDMQKENLMNLKRTADHMFEEVMKKMKLGTIDRKEAADAINRSYEIDKIIVDLGLYELL